MSNYWLIVLQANAHDHAIEHLHPIPGNNELYISIAILALIIGSLILRKAISHETKTNKLS